MLYLIILFVSAIYFLKQIRWLDKALCSMWSSWHKVKSESEVTQSCLTICNPVDCSLPGSSLHGILQARILEWIGIKWVLKSLQSLPEEHFPKHNCRVEGRITCSVLELRRYLLRIKKSEMLEFLRKSGTEEGVRWIKSSRNLQGSLWVCWWKLSYANIR